MATDGDFNQAFASFARRENLPSELTSEEWASVPSEIRERAFFMSKVTDAEILQRFRDGVEDVLDGNLSENDAEKEIHKWLQDGGYEPPPGKAGGLQDLSSLDRINVVIRTNVAMARGHAAWVRDQTAIRLYPAQELIRISSRKMPREWERIWAESRAELADIPGVHATEMIALLNHPIWSKISRFDQPYPPFDFGSGMGVRGVRRDRAKELGFKLDPNNDPMQKPLHRTMNDGLEVTPDIRSEDLKQGLADKLGRLAEWDGDKLVFTDPDRSKKYPAEKIAEIWNRPAVDGYDRLTQKDALEKWGGGAKPATNEDRVTLRKLFDRIETEGQPDQLFKVVRISSATLTELIRGLASKTFTIPGNVAGWEWSKAFTAADTSGWQVAFRVQGPLKSINIEALRPGKPGFVYVGGTRFKVQSFVKDDAAKQTTITLIEE